MRHDIPKRTVEADFKMLSSSVESSEEFAKLFGIAIVSEYAAASAQFPYSLTELGKALGGKSWHFADSLLKQVHGEKNVDLKASDNRYHRADRVNKTGFHNYSEDALNLLEKVRDKKEYQLDLGIPD